jgi:hypothetical protein
VIDDPSMNEDYDYCWVSGSASHQFNNYAEQDRMKFDGYASGQGLSRLKAHLRAWAENGF